MLLIEAYVEKTDHQSRSGVLNQCVEVEQFFHHFQYGSFLFGSAKSSKRGQQLSGLFKVGVIKEKQIPIAIVQLSIAKVHHRRVLNWIE